MIKRLLTPSAYAIVLSAVSTVSSAAEITLKMHHFLPEKAHYQTQFFEPWAESIKQASDGRIDIKIYGSMSLGGKPQQLVDQVQDGYVDIIWTLPGYTPGRFPAISAFENPFMVTDAFETSQALQAYYETHPEVQNEFADMHPLAFWTHDPGVVFSKGEPINSVAAFEGKKIRNPSRPIAAALDALGASPIGMPVPQMPQALAKNVIDGTVIPFEIVPALKLHELVDHAVEIKDDQGRGLYTAVFLLGMNKAKYESMPTDLRQILDDHAGMYFAAYGGEYFKKAEDAGRQLIDENATRQQMPLAEVAKLKAATSNVSNDWIKEMNRLGLPGQTLMDSANDLLEQYKQ